MQQVVLPGGQGNKAGFFQSLGVWYSLLISILALLLNNILASLSLSDIAEFLGYVFCTSLRTRPHDDFKGFLYIQYILPAKKGDGVGNISVGGKRAYGEKENLEALGQLSKNSVMFQSFSMKFTQK